jgi:alkylation response protein AidB-like acyl-CoA dehydrogenase
MDPAMRWAGGILSCMENPHSSELTPGARRWDGQRVRFASGRDALGQAGLLGLMLPAESGGPVWDGVRSRP